MNALRYRVAAMRIAISALTASRIDGLKQHAAALQGASHDPDPRWGRSRYHGRGGRCWQLLRLLGLLLRWIVIKSQVGQRRRSRHSRRVVIGITKR